MPDADDVAREFGETSPVEPGSIVAYGSERRVVVDVTDPHDDELPPVAVLRLTDDDPDRRLDDDGGDVFIEAAMVSELRVVGHI